MTALLLLALAAADPPTVAAPLPAGEPAGVVALAPKVGMWKPSAELGAAVYAGGEAGHVWSWGRHGLALGLEAGYASATGSGTISDPRLSAGSHVASGSYSTRARQVMVLPTIAYRAEVARPLSIYAQLAPGLFLQSTTIRAFNVVVEETEGSFGVRAGAGLEVRLGPGGLFGELHYAWTRMRQPPGDASVTTGGLLPLVGYRVLVGL
jgi:hypothetical protein